GVSLSPDVTEELPATVFWCGKAFALRILSFIPQVFGGEHLDHGLTNQPTTVFTIVLRPSTGKNASAATTTAHTSRDSMRFMISYSPSRACCSRLRRGTVQLFRPRLP